MPASFEIYKSGDRFRWRLRLDTQSLRHLPRIKGTEVAAFGERKRTIDDAIESIEAVKKLIAEATIDIADST